MKVHDVLLVLSFLGQTFVVNTGVTSRAQREYGDSLEAPRVKFFPQWLIPSHCFTEFFLFLTSALVFRNIGIMSWINGPVCKEMRKVWLWLKLPLGIKSVRGDTEMNLRTNQIDRDRCSSEVPARRQSTQGLSPTSPIRGHILFQNLLFCPLLPTASSEPLKLGMTNGSDMCPTFSEIPYCSLLFQTQPG